MRCSIPFFRRLWRDLTWRWLVVDADGTRHTYPYLIGYFRYKWLSRRKDGGFCV